MPARHRFRALAALAPIVTAYAVATGPASAVDVVAVGSVEASEVAPAAPSGGADRYLVRLARGSDVRAEAREMREQGVRVRRTFTHAVDAAAVSATPAEIAALAEDPQVLAIEPDVAVHASATQDGATWGLDRIDQRSLPLSGAFSYPSDAAGVDVYVVDTGVLAGHDELRGRVATGFTAVDDGRGASDCNGHGTHVAGTAAGTGVGVAKAARVVPVRVLGCDGSGTTSQVIAGLDWIVAHHSAGSPAVVNLSLGGPAHAILDRAVERVVADGVTVVVAAGNDAADACLSSPARVPAALTVAATTRQDGQASFSNHGGCVDLYAPGVEIVSAHHSSATAYARMSGTSMAAPHVAGAAAVHLALQSSLTPAEVASRIVTDATPGAVSGATPGTPNRLLFLVQSIAPQPAPEPATAPAPEPVPESNPAPSPAPAPDQTRPGRAKRVTAKAVRRAVKVTWVRPLSVDLTRQVVRVYVGSRQVTALRVPAAAASVRVERLAPGRAYRFTVVGVNRAGRGPESRPSTRVVPGR